MNFVYVCPVSCASAPALWVASLGLDVHRVTLGQYRLILAAMALCWGDELDGQGPRLERTIATPGIEEVAAYVGPAKGQQDGALR